MGRVISIIVFLLGPVLFYGLISCEEPCNPEAYRFVIRDYKAYPRKLNSQSYQTYLTDTLSLTDSIYYQQLELLLIGQDSAIAMNHPLTGGASLWACSPAYIALDTIQHLTITSNQFYRPGLEAVSDLTSNFTIGQGYNQQPITKFLAMPFLGAQSFYSLRLVAAPARAGRYQFRLTIDWGKGKTASLLTRPIFIKP